jgi:TolA-binding protein
MTERLTKKQLKQDKFVEGVRVALTYARENIAVTVLGLIGFVALVTLALRVGGTAIGGDGPQDTEADRALASARGQFLTGSLEAGAAALEDVRSRHSGSRAAREATYLLGNTLYENGEYARAQKAFEDFLKKPLHGDLLRDGARLGIAACKEETGNLAGATSDYLNLWNAPDAHPGTRLQAALAAARCSRAQGLDERARELYEEIQARFPSTLEADEARFQLLQMDGGTAS